MEQASTPQFRATPRSLGALILASVLAGCATVSPPRQTPQPALPTDVATTTTVVPREEITQQARAARDRLSPGVLWVATSADWAEDARAVYADATRFIATEGRRRAAGRWGVVLDVDETVLDNVLYQVEREREALGFTPESWAAWTQRRAAGLVPGASAFIAAVNAAGGHVALVTKRQVSEQFDTEANLLALGLRRGEHYTVLLTRGDAGPSEKSERFALVPAILKAQGHGSVEIIAAVGDGTGDRIAPEIRFFCIDQGAMYGDPCARTR